MCARRYPQRQQQRQTSEQPIVYVNQRIFVARNVQIACLRQGLSHPALSHRALGRVHRSARIGQIPTEKILRHHGLPLCLGNLTEHKQRLATGLLFVGSLGFFLSHIQLARRQRLAGFIEQGLGLRLEWPLRRPFACRWLVLVGTLALAAGRPGLGSRATSPRLGTGYPTHRHECQHDQHRQPTDPQAHLQLPNWSRCCALTCTCWLLPSMDKMWVPGSTHRLDC
jgi:hypothetical protein